MIWKILSFGDYHFDDAFLADQDNPALQPIVASEMIKRGLTAAPAPGGVVREGDYLIVSVIGLSPVQRRELLRAIDVLSGRLEELIGEDNQGSRWYVLARPVRHLWEKGRDVLVFEVADLIWRGKISRRYSWRQSSGSLAVAATVGGNRDALPIWRLTPRGAKSGGFGYTRWIGIYSRVDAALPNYPLEITGGGWDTAALVTAGKMQADGDDIWIYVDGAPIGRWLVGMNSSATRIWCVLSFSPRVELPIKDAIAATGNVSEIRFSASNATLAALNKLAAARNKLVMIDDEVFTYDGVDTKNYALTGVQRAQRWSTAAAHGSGAMARWIEHDIFLFYGNSNIGAPENDESLRPIFDLSNSSNSIWSYSEYYDDEARTRPGSWIPNVIAGRASTTYGGVRGDETTNPPAMRMGMKAAAYLQNGSWKPENGKIEWRISNPCGFTQVDAAGEKYRYAASWGAKAALQKKSASGAYADLWNEASPSATQQWQGFSRNGVGLGGTVRDLRFYFQPSLTATANNEAAFEIYGVTLWLDTTRTPVIRFGGEQSNYWMDTRITCSESGEAIRVRGICPLNSTVEVDCNKKIVRMGGKDAFWMLDLDSFRERWMGLPPGTVNLLIEDAGATAVDVELEFEERRV